MGGIPEAMLIASVVSAGVGAAGAISQGQASAQQSQYQSAVAVQNQQIQAQNAELARRNAAYAEQAGAGRIDDRARQLRQQIGSQRAAYAAAGLLTEFGTPADVINDTAVLGQAAIAETRQDADRRAMGFRIQANNADAEGASAGLRSQAYGEAADDAITGGNFGAGASLLSGAATGFDRWSRMRSTGVPMARIPNFLE